TRWLARGRGDARCAESTDARGDADSDLRCVGARLLHRLSQRASPLRRGILESGELGIRQPESEIGQNQKSADYADLRRLPQSNLELGVICGFSLAFPGGRN